MVPYTQDMTFQSRHIVDGALSPAGDDIVMTVVETIVDHISGTEAQRSTLWRGDASGTAARRLTSEHFNSTMPRFDADGRSLYFLSAKDSDQKDSQVHRLPMQVGEAIAITTLPGGVTAFALSPNGAHLACVSTGVPAVVRGSNDHVRISRSLYRYDPVPGYLQDAAHSLFVVDLRTSAITRLVEPDGLITTIAWAPDSLRIAFVRQMGAANDSFALGDLCVVSLDGSEQVLVAHTFLQTPFWTSDGLGIGYFGPPSGDPTRQSQLWIVPATGGAPSSRTAGIDRPVPSLFQFGSPAIRSVNTAFVAADSVVVMLGDGGQGQLVSVALSGDEQVETLLSGQQIVRLLDGRNGRMLYTEQSWNTPTTLRLKSVEAEDGVLVADLNSGWHGTVLWPTIEHMNVQSADGSSIETWTLLPSGVAAPHKALLYIHGGPHAAWGCGFSEDIHELVGAGYAVVLVNPRGSVGYGDTFATAIAGRWGEIELEDFHAALDALIERGLLDGARLGVMGVSGGGHLAAQLITHSDRFKAAVPEQGVYNMFSMYGVADCGPMLVGRELGGKPHEKPQLYWQLSPVANAHRCSTPTLLIQGEDDLRCPMEQAEEFYTALREAGCSVELLRLRHCKHATQVAGPPPLRRYRMDAIKDWFDRYLS